MVGKGSGQNALPMENWKVGEVHGVFEVIQSLDAADAQRATMVQIFAGLVLLCLVIPAVIYDGSTGRGLHDKAAGSIAIRANISNAN